MTHTNYELSKKLKAFMGEDAPCLLGGVITVYDRNGSKQQIYVGQMVKEDTLAYTLEDILSKAFCEAMAKRAHPHQFHSVFPGGAEAVEVPMGHLECFVAFSRAYYSGGHPALERELIRMMGSKQEDKI